MAETHPVTMKQLLEAGVHFGHQTQRWNPKMKQYIFGERNGIYIIDLQKTVKLFRDAYEFVMKQAGQGGSVLFVGTKKQAQDIIAEEARRGGQYFVTNRWLGGTLTNFKTVKGSIDRLKTLEKMATDGSFERLPKKEVIKLEREREKLERNLGGIKDMARLPAVLFVIDPAREQIAVREANKLGIAVVSIVDTNCDPEEIDFVVPGNDDAIRAIKLFAGAIANACIEGNSKYQEFLAARPRDDKPAAEAERPRRGKIPGGPEVEVVRRPVVAEDAPGVEPPVATTPVEQEPEPEPEAVAGAGSEAEPVVEPEPEAVAGAGSEAVTEAAASDEPASSDATSDEAGAADATAEPKPTAEA